MVAVAVAAFGNMKLVSVPVVVEVPVRLPVQLAPVAQQAMLSAASREQLVPCLQQAFALPSSVHGFVPLGQLSARRRMRRTSKARRLAASAGVKGDVRAWVVRNVVASQIQGVRILVVFIDVWIVRCSLFVQGVDVLMSYRDVNKLLEEARLACRRDEELEPESRVTHFHAEEGLQRNRQMFQKV